MKTVNVYFENSAEPVVYERVTFVRWATSPLLAVAGVNNYIYLELSDGQEITINRVFSFSVS